VLPKVYARQNLDPSSLGELIDLISNIALGDAQSRSADVLGHVFEYLFHFTCELSMPRMARFIFASRQVV
jgi:type I restriction-modification system DNA methylase subunit